MKFLEKVAAHLYRNYGSDLSQVCVVLPNRRGGLFLKKHLASIITGPSWAPVIFSIEDFITGMSDLRLIDNLQVLFELYEVHRALEGPKAQPFEEFMSWGQQLLHDFNEIDAYMVDPEQLFGYLSESRALSLWNLDQKPLTEFEQKYLHFYQGLWPYYSALNERLLKKNLAYQGMIFRHALENLPRSMALIPWKKVVFTGFNALTVAEERIFEEMALEGKAEFLWDADRYYTEDRFHEAGDFLRRWMKKSSFLPFQWLGNDYAELPREIRITGAASDTGQVKVCGEILDEWCKAGIRQEEIAVVLVDEQLMSPLLNSIPGSVTSMNITMGLPLRQSPVYNLAAAVFSMHLNAEKFSSAAKPGNKFYYRDVLTILQHPFVQLMVEKGSDRNRFVLQDITALIRNGSRVFLGKEDIVSLVPGLFPAGNTFADILFTPWLQASDAFGSLAALITSLRESFTSAGNDKKTELEILFSFSCILQRMESLISEYNAVTSLQTLYQLFRQIAESSTIPFYGEPLKGIQVMGMLETRTLDFENVILLSVNEDLLPSGRTSQSFIPFDTRNTFGLPTYRHKNSVYAYHFYRFLQRAGKISLLYLTEPNELGGGESSRFIKQLAAELPAVNRSVIITDEILSLPPVPGQTSPEILIPKDGTVMERIREKAKEGLSPSSMNNYRQCTLRFYFTAIAGFRESSEMEETIDAPTFGQAVHKTLEDLFKPFLDHPLKPADFDTMLNLYKKTLVEAFGVLFNGADIHYGKNLLMVSMAGMMLEKYLREEQRNIKELEQRRSSRVVKFLEHPLQKEFTCPVNGKDELIRIKGFADRIDLEGGDLWKIIDYKSGSVNQKDLAFDDWQALGEDSSLRHSFQLLTYAYLLAAGMDGQELKIQSGIVSLKKTGNGFMAVPSPSGADDFISRTDLAEFEKILLMLIGELFDPSIPFKQTTDTDNCKFCPFKDICTR